MAPRIREGDASGFALAPLRVGYVTGDLHRQHPVNIFMLPLLLQQKNSPTLTVCVYHTGNMHDHYTAQARACAQVWHEAAHWSDAALHEQIVADGVDVLVDLAGHTASHRLGVFAMRSARVQATFLGYPHSTGLPCMDYLIGDPVVSPQAHQHLFTETIAQLPASVFCWSPVDDYPLPPPRAPGEPLVLGSFNNALKLSPKTLALWARVLHALPQAKLLLKAPSFTSEEVCAVYRARLQAHGIAPERLMFRGPSELGLMMQAYGEMDIALDPLAYNGGTTTLQALWKGVPVVTLQGHNFLSRMGASFLQTLGEQDWLAHDEDAYLAAVLALAADLPRLRTGRAALRREMQDSALCDIERYARDFEHLLRDMVADRTPLSLTAEHQA